MPKVSVNILTKNRAELLQKALLSVSRQNFTDFEIVIVNDGSTDGTQNVIQAYRHLNIQALSHKSSIGITLSRQEALEASKGEYIAILDDDDEWIDGGKLAKQVKYLDEHQECVLLGGGVEISNFPACTCLRQEPMAGRQFPISNEIPNPKLQIIKYRAGTDEWIRNTMLFRNNFFTSTVMFRREAAIKAGGFVKDDIDLAEDYDLWLRLGKTGKMRNFHEVFARYSLPAYNKEVRNQFFKKQFVLAAREKHSYPHFWLASLILRFRIGLW